MIERHIQPEELATFSECFVIGTAAEVTPVAEIGEYRFTPGQHLARPDGRLRQDGPAPAADGVGLWPGRRSACASSIMSCCASATVSPANPYAWLVSAGRFKTIDRWRRQARLAGALPEPGRARGADAGADHARTDRGRRTTADLHLLPPGARAGRAHRADVARGGGLTTEEIARAYLVPAPTIAQRIVRAKAKIRDEAIPYEVPDRAELPARIESVLQVVYLIFNEGYAGDATGRT